MDCVHPTWPPEGAIAMANAMYELNPVSRITVGTIGRPGERLFLLQAASADETLTLKLEKEQVYALARGIDELLERLEQQEQIAGAAGEPSVEDLELGEPIEPAFAVAQMGLAFDGAVGMMVLVLAGGLEIEAEDASTARLWATPAQMRALSRLAKAHNARHIFGTGTAIALLSAPVKQGQYSGS